MALLKTHYFPLDDYFTEAKRHMSLCRLWDVVLNPAGGNIFLTRFPYYSYRYMKVNILLKINRKTFQISAFIKK